MFAVIKAGARQYKVAKGETISLDYAAGKVGDKVIFDQVLMLGGDKPTVGAPVISGAKVSAVIKEVTRAPKVIIFKYKRRKNYKKTSSHRQPQTVVEVQDIKAN